MKLKYILFLTMLTIFACNSTQPIDSQPFKKYKIGDYNITTIYNNRASIGIDNLTNATPTIIYSLVGNDRCYTSKNSFLLEKDNVVILIDSGLANLLGNQSNFFAENLIKAGYKAEDIKYLLLNHINADIGVADEIEDIKFFPNAKVYLSKPEHTFWVTPDNVSKATVPKDNQYNFNRAKSFADKYTDIVTFVKDNSTASRDNISFENKIDMNIIPLKGFSAGHYGFELLLDNNTTLFFSGDIFHCLQAQIFMQLINTSFELFPTDSVISRSKVMNDYTILKHLPSTPTFDEDGILIPTDNESRRQRDIIIAGAHLPFPSFYKIFKTKDGLKYILLNQPNFKDELYNR